MNPRQKKFVKLWMSGVPAGRAYEQAGYDTRGDVADVSASQLLRNPKVAKYIKTMNEKTEKSTILSITERKELLTRIAMANEGERPSDAIRASAELSKMDGAYEHVEQLGTIKINIGGDDKSE
jgi:phage terminase small subunit